MMQVDPTLLQIGGLVNQEPDLSGIDPALLQLSKSMAAARTGKIPSGTDATLEDGQVSDPISLEDEVSNVQDILADFMETHADFKLKYHRADLVRSIIMAILDEEADQFRAVFGPRMDRKAKKADPKVDYFIYDLSTLMSLVPTLPPEDEPDALFESLVSPTSSQLVKLVDLIAKKKYSARARVKRAVREETSEKVEDREVSENQENTLPESEQAGTYPPDSPLMETESGIPISLDQLEAAVLDYQATPDSPGSSTGNSKRPRGRPKGSLNKTHVPAWQTKENRRIRQKERRELYRAQRAEESERKRREDPHYVSPRRRVGRPRKTRDAMGELLAGAGVTEDGVRFSLMEGQEGHALDTNEMHAAHQEELQPHHHEEMTMHDHQEMSTHEHEEVGMDLDMSTGMGLDMAAMGLDFQTDPADFGQLSHDHLEHHDHHNHHEQHQQDQHVEHDDLQHHHRDTHDHPSLSMHADDGVMQMLAMPPEMGDMTVGEEETNYLTYGAETYAYTLDAIERAHAAVREEEERNGVQ